MPVRALVMGILNVTPDSFSDGGLHDRPSAAIAHGRRLIAEGADVVDVGGESSRPGASAVDEDTELERVLPVVEALASDVRVSVDTAKPAVARAAVAAGATLLNDVTASLAPVAAELGVGWVAMHMQGEPRTMQIDPRYDDVVSEVLGFLVERAAAARAAGLREVWVDPGIGFGKTQAHNWALLAALPSLVEAGFPVVIGTSRKTFLGALTASADGATDPAPTDDRLEASVSTAVRAVLDGAAMVRVHDVAETVAALGAVAA
ncbi:MAG: dihydropteroate synthase [Acidimicrobiales bacterium]|nr:dihydropteroate synthase [Acidimicrobiales bacterium]